MKKKNKKKKRAAELIGKRGEKSVDNKQGNSN